MWKYLNKYMLYLPVVALKTQNFHKAQKELEASQMVIPEEAQKEKLQKIIHYAKKHVPYYAEKLKEIDPYSFHSLTDIRRLPTLNKATLKKNANHIVSQKKFHFLTRKTTGGSTGQPLTIYKNRTALGYELAATWRGYSWAGISIGDKQARFWGIPMTWRGKLFARLTDVICNRYRLSAFSFNQESLKQYTVRLNKYKPDYFYGYVSMIVEYADYIFNNNIELQFQPKAIITTSEVLYPEYRDKLRRAFGCNQIHNEYGCGEVGTIAHECEAGKMHISSENMIIEILNGESPCNNGEVGEIVVTDLRNYAMPLIRYRMGDYAAISTEECSCGRKLPTLSHIKGRAYDTIILADGKKYHGEYFMYVMEAAEKKKLGIKKFQIIQTSICSIKVKIIPDDNYNKSSEHFIVDGIKRSFECEVQVSIDLVTHIDRESSGKMRLIVGLENN